MLAPSIYPSVVGKPVEKFEGLLSSRNGKPVCTVVLASCSSSPSAASFAAEFWSPVTSASGGMFTKSIHPSSPECCNRALLGDVVLPSTSPIIPVVYLLVLSIIISQSSHSIQVSQSTQLSQSE